jgi:hypothetical protein
MTSSRYQLSTSGTDSDDSEAEATPIFHTRLILLPMVIAVYPCSKTVSKKKPLKKLHHAITVNHPAGDDFISSLYMGKTQYNQITFETTTNYYIVRKSENSFIPPNWVDFAFLYSLSDINNLQTYKIDITEPKACRHDTPLFYKFTMLNDNQLTLERCSTKVSDLPYTFFSTHKHPNFFSQLLEILGKISTQLAEKSSPPDVIALPYFSPRV